VPRLILPLFTLLALLSGEIFEVSKETHEVLLSRPVKVAEVGREFDRAPLYLRKELADSIEQIASATRQRWLESGAPSAFLCHLLAGPMAPIER
jgi:hypothetical protein